MVKEYCFLYFRRICLNSDYVDILNYWLFVNCFVMFNSWFSLNLSHCLRLRYITFIICYIVFITCICLQFRKYDIPLKLIISELEVIHIDYAKCKNINEQNACLHALFVDETKNHLLTRAGKLIPAHCFTLLSQRNLLSSIAPEQQLR